MENNKESKLRLNLLDNQFELFYGVLSMEMIKEESDKLEKVLINHNNCIHRLQNNELNELHDIGRQLISLRQKTKIILIPYLN